MVPAAAGGLMSASAQEELIARIRVTIAAEALPNRRARTCDRKIRQPVSKWPRMLEPVSLSSPTLCEVTVIASHPGGRGWRGDVRMGSANQVWMGRVQVVTGCRCHR